MLTQKKAEKLTKEILGRYIICQGVTRDFPLSAMLNEEN
jgi:hypothetical protein